ncbi:MAG: hypothetical protein L0387_10605 [Acidobacteria bacterium]|nr:hypothetical protein [Acidobacteriota bacterium]
MPRKVSGLNKEHAAVSQHPVRDALEKALVSGLRQISAQYSKARRQFGDGFSAGTFLRRSPLVKKCLEIESWVKPDTSVGEERQAKASKLAETLQKAGWPYEPTAMFAEAVERRGSGAPPKKRALAIRALEAKLTNPKFSWMRFTQKNCDCGSSDHRDHCKQAIRQNVIHLQRLIRKHNLLPPPSPSQKRR